LGLSLISTLDLNCGDSSFPGRLDPRSGREDVRNKAKKGSASSFFKEKYEFESIFWSKRK
ncbi:hypothetical protein J6590_030021, partial [Homalodisca vitripennis]